MLQVQVDRDRVRTMRRCFFVFTNISKYIASTSDHMVLLKFEVCTVCQNQELLGSHSAFTSDRMVLIEFKVCTACQLSA